MVEVWEVIGVEPNLMMSVQAYRDGNRIWGGAVNYQMIENTVKRDGALILIPKGGNPNRRLV